VKLDEERLARYLDDIAAETIDIESIVGIKGKKTDGLLQDPHNLKSLKYSTIVIAEAIASTLQHILAKKFNVVIDGYMSIFTESKKYDLISAELLNRLHPFFRFRNMLAPQYWRVNDKLFIENLRAGLDDFRTFVNEIRQIISQTVKPKYPINPACRGEASAKTGVPGRSHAASVTKPGRSCLPCSSGRWFRVQLTRTKVESIP
jgi:uncharacterized protein YutE (UPF0331/DUF86 family)